MFHKGQLTAKPGCQNCPERVASVETTSVERFRKAIGEANNHEVPVTLRIPEELSLGQDVSLLTGSEETLYECEVGEPGAEVGPDGCQYAEGVQVVSAIYGAMNERQA
jgi:hypothetical protein